ncbi:hypothetical protein EDB86DRAFT_2827684 [Lactarius hatsudake]|nr:hypothetical protein EDB86DRAFT_2827684 [Lactarius hatsudake]
MPNESYINFDPILGLDYPDPSHPKIKNHISEMHEVIDLLVRICVTPGGGKILRRRRQGTFQPARRRIVLDAAKDEAYIDFPEPGSSVATLIVEYANLSVSCGQSPDTEQELWARGNLVHIALKLCSPRAFFTGIHPPRRLSIALAQPLLVQILSNIKASYNISTPTAHLALHALSPASLRAMNANIERIKVSRAALLSELHNLRD